MKSELKDNKGNVWFFDPITGCLEHPCGYLTSWLRDNAPESRWAMLESAGDIPQEIVEKLNA